MRRQTLAAVTATAAALLAAPVAQAGAPAATSSPYPGGTYSPPAASYGTGEDTDLSVLVDDGTKINVQVSYPTDLKTGKRITNKTFPVLVTQDTYSGGIGRAESLLGGGSSYFVERGYIFVRMDVRGTGKSEGKNGLEELFSPRQGLDGLEIAYWAADPANVPGSSGAVGLQGCSALGISQLATLMQLGRIEREGGGTISYAYEGRTYRRTVNGRTNPIKAAIPQCLAGDMYRDTFFDNGIPSPIEALAITPVGLALSGPALGEPSQNVGGTLDGVDVLNGGGGGYYRGFWQANDRVAAANDLARTGVPLLGWVGWGEGGFIGAQQLYGVLQNAAAGKANPWGPMEPDQKPSPKYQMIIGDWGHAGGLDQGLELEWYDTWIKGVSTGLAQADQPLHMQELQPKQATDTAGATTTTERFINATTYPQLASYTSYHLNGGGTLTRTAPKAGTPDLLPFAPAASVTYTLNQPFAQDMTLEGPSSVQLWAQSTGTNMSFFAELNDVDPATGVVTAIEHGSILASRRERVPHKSWTIAHGKLGTAAARGAKATPIAPYLSLTRDDFSTPPNTPVELQIPLQPTTWRLNKGHLLQLVIASQGPQSECAANAKIGAAPTGCFYTKPMLRTLPGVYQLLHDSQHPSQLSVAMVPSHSLDVMDAKALVTPTSGGVALPSKWGSAAPNKTAPNKRK